MKDKSDIMNALTANCDTSKSIVTKNIPTNDETVVDVEDDFSYAREHIKNLIDTSDEAIQTMHHLAQDAEHPRAFEVLGQLIKQNAEMNNQLMDLAKSRKDLRQESGNNTGSTTTNNAIFVGTTNELQRFLKDQNTIDVDSE